MIVLNTAFGVAEERGFICILGYRSTDLQEHAQYSFETFNVSL